MKKIYVALSWSAASLALAQEETEGAGGGPAGEASGSFTERFMQNYTGDILMWGWVVVTLAVAYAIATFAYLLLLGNRNPAVAARYALFWGGLSLLLIHFFFFGALLDTKLEPLVVFMIGLGIFIAVIVLLTLLRRKR